MNFCLLTETILFVKRILMNHYNLNILYMGYINDKREFTEYDTQKSNPQSGKPGIGFKLYHSRERYHIQCIH